MNKILTLIQVLAPLTALLTFGIGLLRGMRAGMPAIEPAVKVSSGLIIISLVLGAIAGVNGAATSTTNM